MLLAGPTLDPPHMAPKQRPLPAQSPQCNTKRKQLWRRWRHVFLKQQMLYLEEAVLQQLCSCWALSRLMDEALSHHIPQGLQALQLVYWMSALSCSLRQIYVSKQLLKTFQV